MAMASPSTLLFTLSFLIPYFLLHSVSAICHFDDETGLLGFKSGITRDPSGMFHTWRVGSDCCAWAGVRCNDNNRVVALSLYGDLDDPIRYLAGTISPSLAKLQYMSDINLVDLRNISGTFPSFLFDAPNLRYAYIANSKLSGPLPADIGRLSRYNTLSLIGNQFTGPLPRSISQLTQLTTLALGNNHLTGPIPDGIRNLTSLSYLDLSQNKLSGKIPDFFSSLRNLTVLNLSNNRFSGEIPASISTLAPKLTYLGLSHNSLTGKIPDYFGNFIALDRLDISSNHFTGVVPKTFKNLTKISRLNLSRNKLIDPFPEMNVTGIELLDLSYNQFKLGKIPNWVSSSSIIYSLKLARCGIKMKFEDFKPVETFYYNYIDLSHNQITGSPIRLLNQTNLLEEFLASGNQLKFNMSDLKLPKTLKVLDLSRNQIFGNVAVNISGLNTLNVSYNHLCGKLPVNKFPVSSFQGNACLCGSPLPQCKS